LHRRRCDAHWARHKKICWPSAAIARLEEDEPAVFFESAATKVIDRDATKSQAATRGCLNFVWLRVSVAYACSRHPVSSVCGKAEEIEDEKPAAIFSRMTSQPKYLQQPYFRLISFKFIHNFLIKIIDLLKIIGNEI